LVAKLGDWLVFLVAIGLLLLWLWKRFDRWLHEPPGHRIRKLAESGEVLRDEAVELLESHGYEVLSGKHRVPLGVKVDEGPMQPTRLYFDYLAVKEDLYYLVKLEKTRMPIDWTASGLRDRLMVYSLLFPDCEGIVVADPVQRWVRTVRFKVEDENG
jgi:hypothetical protein